MAQCSTEYFSFYSWPYIWLPVLFAYKGIILLVGLFLAFETRKVKIKSLNDSRFIAMSVYGTVIVSVTLTPIGFLLQNFPNVPIWNNWNYDSN